MKVLKWDVPVGAPVPIGAGKVVHVGVMMGMSNPVYVWTEESRDDGIVTRQAQIVGTGAEVPEGWEHVGTAITPAALVWHVYVNPNEDPE